MLIKVVVACCKKTQGVTVYSKQHLVTGPPLPLAELKKKMSDWMCTRIPKTTDNLLLSVLQMVFS